MVVSRRLITDENDVLFSDYYAASLTISNELWARNMQKQACLQSLIANICNL